MGGPRRALGHLPRTSRTFGARTKNSENPYLLRGLFERLGTAFDWSPACHRDLKVSQRLGAASDCSQEPRLTIDPAPVSNPEAPLDV